MVEKIKIVENGIYVDIKELKKIIIDEWQSGEFYNWFHNQGNRGEGLYKLILGEISDYSDGLLYETERIAQKNLNLPDNRLDWSDLYPKSDSRSIGFEVMNLLGGGFGMSIEELIVDDISIILEFLDTPADKSLEAWDKWEKYWTNLDYPARRKKLLRDPKYIYTAKFYASENVVCQGDIYQAQDLLYQLTKEFLGKNLIAQGNEVVENGELRILYQAGEEFIRIQLSSYSNFDITIDGLTNFKKAIQEKIKASENPNHPRVITNIIKNI